MFDRFWQRVVVSINVNGACYIFKQIRPFYFIAAFAWRVI